MPRKAREKSSTGIYAILLESEYSIFRDDEDYNEFIGRIDDYLDMGAIAFALIEKAICLIVKESEKGIGMDIKPITTSYARYYGARYGLDGGLFKQRFKSMPIETAEDMALNLACIHKLCDTLSAEGYTGRYEGDDLFIPESAMALMGDTSRYDAIMAEGKALAPLYAVLAGEKAKVPVKKAPAKKAAAKKKPVVEEKVTLPTVAEEKAVEPVAPKAEGTPKPKKKKNMPTWLL